MTAKPLLRPFYALLLLGSLLLLPPMGILLSQRETLSLLSEQRAARQQQATAASLLLLHREELQQQSQRLQTLSDEASLFHQGANDSGIQIVVLTQARNLVQGAGLSIRSIDARAGDIVGGRRRLTVALSAMGPMEQVMVAITALEAARPRLFVSRLRLLSAAEAGFVSAPDNPFLSLELEIDAYAQISTP